MLAGCNKMRKIRAYKVQTEQCTIQKHKIQIEKKTKHQDKNYMIKRKHNNGI